MHKELRELKKNWCKAIHRLEVFSVTNLSWVKAVEAKIPSKQIVESFGLLETTDYFPKNKIEAILIGCTHFPYFLEDYQSRTPITCINPDDFLREKLQEIAKKGEPIWTHFFIIFELFVLFPVPFANDRKENILLGLYFGLRQKPT